MSDLDLAKLRALAAAATQPGPWSVYRNTSDHRESCTVLDANGMWVAECGPSPEDAAFIAALNPTTALALVERVEGLQAEVERLRGVIESFASDLDGSAVSLLATELRNRTKAEEPK